MVRMVKALMLCAGLAVAGTLVASATLGLSAINSAAASGMRPFNTIETCTSLSPCFDVRNDGAGIAIRARSRRNEAILGVTDFSGSTGTEFHNGVFGFDDSTSNNDLNDGVAGLSNNGTGVFGETRFDSSHVPISQFGVLAQDVSKTFNSNTAVFAFSQHNTGVFAFSGNDGSSIAPAIDSQSTGGIALRAQSLGKTSLADAIIAVADQGFAINGSSQGFEGGVISAPGTGFTGFTTGSGIGLSGSDSSLVVPGIHGTGVMGFGGAYGVLAVTTGVDKPLTQPQNAAIFAVCFNGAPAFIAATKLFDPTTYTSEMDCSGNLTIKGRLTTGKSPMIASRSSTGSNLISYGSREAQPTMEDVGEATLINGHAYVGLEPAFSSTIDRQSTYLVFLTPEGDSRGLFVTRRTMTGFQVSENQGGHSTVAFSYRIVAKPYGDNAPRLPSAESVRRALQTVPPIRGSAAQAIAPLRLPSIPRHLLVPARKFVPRLINVPR